MSGNVSGKMGERISVRGEELGLVKSVMFSGEDGGRELVVFRSSEDGKRLRFGVGEEGGEGDLVVVGG